jgi:hypothetical protein
MMVYHRWCSESYSVCWVSISRLAVTDLDCSRLTRLLDMWNLIDNGKLRTVAEQDGCAAESRARGGHAESILAGFRRYFFCGSELFLTLSGQAAEQSDR